MQQLGGECESDEPADALQLLCWDDLIECLLIASQTEAVHLDRNSENAQSEVSQ